MGFRNAVAGLSGGLARWLAAGGAKRDLKEVVHIVDGFQMGTIRPHKDSERLQRYFRIEQDRLNGYRDTWEAVQNSEIVDQAFKKLAEDSTAENFHIKCDDKRALDEMWAVLDRIQYFGQRRTEMMMRLRSAGDLFSFVDKDWHPSRKRNLAEITSVRCPAEYTMFRLSDERGVFPDWNRAFIQIPQIRLAPAGNWSHGSALLHGDNRFLAGGGGYYAGLVGENARTVVNKYYDKVYVYAVDDVIHSRSYPGWQPVQTGYGICAMRSGRGTYNIVMMCLIDLAIARKLSTFNRLHHDVDPNVASEKYDKYKENIEESEAAPDKEYVTAGVKITAVDARNRQLVDIDDLWLHIDRLLLALEYPLPLTGFGAERFTGEILDRMEQRLKRTIRIMNQIEEYEFLRPLLYRQLMYSGKADVKFEIEFPAISLEDDNKKSKRILSKVQAGVMSRRTGSRLMDGTSDEEFEEELIQIAREIALIGPPVSTGRKPESLEKGGKGVEKEDTATQDIVDEEGIGDE